MTMTDVSRTATSPTRATLEVRPDRQLQAEQAMVRASIVGILVALPITMAVLIGMMGIAIGSMQPWYVWTALGAGMGVYAAGFLGSVAGVLISAERLDHVSEADDSSE